MSEKRLTRCWKKGNTKFPSIYGVKDFYAWELILHGEVKLNKDEIKKLDLRNNSSEQLQRISMKEAGQILEKKGYKWCKL